MIDAIQIPWSESDFNGDFWAVMVKRRLFLPPNATVWKSWSPGFGPRRAGIERSAAGPDTVIALDRVRVQPFANSD